MVKNFLLTNRGLQDLNPLLAGEEACLPGHIFGPAVRQYTLIHYVFRGKGTFYARGGKYPVSAGQAFIILPEEITTYQADQTDPWHYFWIGFNGSLSASFSRLPPVISLPEIYFQNMQSFSSQSATVEYLLAGELFKLYAHLFADAQEESPRVRRIKDYIRSHYMYPIRVERIAEELNLDRRYLSRQFKAEAGVSIQEYLIRTRLKAAERLLRLGYSVKEAGHLAGYEDTANFSKMFKKVLGKSPISIKKKREA